MKPIAVLLLAWWFVMHATGGPASGSQPLVVGPFQRQVGLRPGAAVLDAARVRDVAAVLPRLITGPREQVATLWCELAPRRHSVPRDS